MSSQAQSLPARRRRFPPTARPIYAGSHAPAACGQRGWGPGRCCKRWESRCAPTRLAPAAGRAGSGGGGGSEGGGTQQRPVGGCCRHRSRGAVGPVQNCMAARGAPLRARAASARRLEAAGGVAAHCSGIGAAHRAPGRPPGRPSSGRQQWQRGAALTGSFRSRAAMVTSPEGAPSPVKRFRLQEKLRASSVRQSEALRLAEEARDVR